MMRNIIVITAPTAETGLVNNLFMKRDKRRHREGATPILLVKDLDSAVTIIEYLDELWINRIDREKVSFENR